MGVLKRYSFCSMRAFEFSWHCRLGGGLLGPDAVPWRREPRGGVRWRGGAAPGARRVCAAGGGVGRLGRPGLRPAPPPRRPPRPHPDRPASGPLRAAGGPRVGGAAVPWPRRAGRGGGGSGGRRRRAHARRRRGGPAADAPAGRGCPRRGAAVGGGRPGIRGRLLLSGRPPPGPPGPAASAPARRRDGRRVRRHGRRWSARAGGSSGGLPCAARVGGRPPAAGGIRRRLGVESAWGVALCGLVHTGTGTAGELGRRSRSHAGAPASGARGRYEPLGRVIRDAEGFGIGHCQRGGSR